MRSATRSAAAAARTARRARSAGPAAGRARRRRRACRRASAPSAPRPRRATPSARCCRDRAMTPCCVRLTISTSRTCGSMSPARNPRSMMPMPPSSAWTIAIGARVTVSMLADTIGRLQREVLRDAARQVDRRRDRGARATLRCGVSRKSSNVQPRTSSATACAAAASMRGNSWLRHTGDPNPLVGARA